MNNKFNLKGPYHEKKFVLKIQFGAPLGFKLTKICWKLVIIGTLNASMLPEPVTEMPSTRTHFVTEMPSMRTNLVTEMPSTSKSCHSIGVNHRNFILKVFTLTFSELYTYGQQMR